jgi:hypothetical protein
MRDDSPDTEIRLVFAGRPAVAYPVRGAVLVELPRVYDGAHPLRDGRLLGELRVATHRSDVPVSETGDPTARGVRDHTCDSGPVRLAVGLTVPDPMLRRLGVDGRVLPLSYPCDRDPLSFRSTHDRPRIYGFHPVDEDVVRCERCGAGGRLHRDYDDDRLPALCDECFLDQTGCEILCCEEWCNRDLDHDGLCAPE